ncbi:MAG: hypothetical protein ROZ64_12645 [Burkholderiaceae bacterium]|jgi:formylmethanofuran dehydrogenase subunit E|nr:hypothetical protein [Burkholderiaceae bacterium]
MSIVESPRAESFPSFFAEAPVVEMQDPLAEFLGAVEAGRLRYRYEDVVRMAGHSCPTVASAFLMTRAALRRLYGDELPRRGEIRVEMRERRDAGVTGVVAAVATFVTGATEDSGFPGLGGRFGRRERLFFGRPIDGEMRFSRIDRGGVGVEVAANLQRVGSDPRMSMWMGRSLHGEASDEETAAFRSAWQDRVRRLLLEHADDPDVIEVRDVRI